MRVVHVQPNTVKQSTNRTLLNITPVQQISVPPPHHNLSTDSNDLVIFLSYRTGVGVRIVKDDGDTSLGNTRLPGFVDKLVEIGDPNEIQVGNTQDETDGIEDVGFAWRE